MDKPNAFVFYFTFAVEDEQEVTMGFVVADASAMFDSLSADGFEHMVDRLYEEGQIDKIESEFGVHDWSSSPSPEVDAIGYCTYEVDASQILMLMERWRKVFAAGSPTEAIEVPKSVTQGSDLDVYQYITTRNESVS